MQEFLFVFCLVFSCFFFLLKVRQNILNLVRTLEKISKTEIVLAIARHDGFAPMRSRREECLPSRSEHTLNEFDVHSQILFSCGMRRA